MGRERRSSYRLSLNKWQIMNNNSKKLGFTSFNLGEKTRPDIASYP